MKLISFERANSWKEFGIDCRAGIVRYEVKLPVYELMMTTHIKHQVLSTRRVGSVLMAKYSAAKHVHCLE